MLQMYLLVYTNGIDPYIAHRAFLLIDKYQTNCTAAHAVAVPLLVSEMANTVTAKGPRRPLQSSGDSARC